MKVSLTLADKNSMYNNIGFADIADILVFVLAHDCSQPSSRPTCDAAVSSASFVDSASLVCFYTLTRIISPHWIVV